MYPQISLKQNQNGDLGVKNNRDKTSEQIHIQKLQL